MKERSTRIEYESWSGYQTGIVYMMDANGCPRFLMIYIPSSRRASFISFKESVLDLDLVLGYMHPQGWLSGCNLLLIGTDAPIRTEWKVQCVKAHTRADSCVQPTHLEAGRLSEGRRPQVRFLRTAYMELISLQARGHELYCLLCHSRYSVRKTLLR